jgi:hypothetical protein
MRLTNVPSSPSCRVAVASHYNTPIPTTATFFHFPYSHLLDTLPFDISLLRRLSLRRHEQNQYTFFYKEFMINE